MESILNKAIQSVQEATISLSKYVTANDVGATGAHQSGFHIPKNSWQLFFDNPGEKGNNKDGWVNIKWQHDFETQSRCIYYGVGTRNEYRLTRFGKGFPYFHDENVGDLLVMTTKDKKYFEAYVLSSDDDIEGFLTALNISSTDINGIIPKQFEQTLEEKLLSCFSSFINTLKVDFPPTIDLATNARNCYNAVHKISSKQIMANPDKEILGWLDSEFQLFKSIENIRYSERIQTPFQTVEELIVIANTILNRRKSRAGKSLEHHLSEIFKTFAIEHDTQTITEDNKKPDFIFPNGAAYHDPSFDEKKLVMLASKTTCKDRWRQVLDEADRVKTKYLFTLQQGVSQSQLQQMYKANVCLVVPKPYLKNFPEQYKDRILTLDSFIQYLKQV
ncbi:MAG: type II restriction endonuclease [Taibaiella sp.]|jgi:type II restriction enzyme